MKEGGGGDAGEVFGKFLPMEGVRMVWSFWTWSVVCGDGAEDCSAGCHPSVQNKKHKVNTRQHLRS